MLIALFGLPEFSISFFRVLWIINIIVVATLTVFYFNQAFHMILSIFTRKRKYKETDNYHKYGYIIPACNEEDVIGDLIDSIKNQDYPSNMMKIYVVADNCTDDTASVASAKGATVFIRSDKENVGKSYALDYAFKKILEEDKECEAFFIFDADNTVDKNFTKEINKAFDLGKNVITGYRAPKNFGDSWLSAGSSYMYLRESRHIHHTRSRLNIGTYVSGTGYLVCRKLIEEFGGWPFRTLVEDVELSAFLTKRGEKIAFVEDAIFYDEQPPRIKGFWRQRLRWCRGNHQVFAKEGGGLLLSFLKKPSLTKWGMFVHILPLPAITYIWFNLYTIIGFIYFLATGVDGSVYFNECLIYCIEGFLYPFAFVFIEGIVLICECWKQVKANPFKKIWYIMLFPVSMYFLFPATVIALFKKVKWVPTRQLR